MPREKIVAVYGVRHQKGRNTYIGGSNDCRRRRREHFGLLRLGQHHCLAMQADYNRDGEAAFDFVILGACRAF